MTRQYRQYRLKGNLGGNRPARVLYFDTETTVYRFGRIENHYLRLCWTCFVKSERAGYQSVKWLYHNDTYELCKYIDKCVAPKTALYIFAHNAFFDLQVSDFYYYFTKWGWTLEFTYDQGMTYILVIRQGKRSIKVLSTTNFFPYSLKQLGDYIDLPKLDVSFEKADIQELSTYCRRDVEIVKEAMEYWWSFLDQHDLGNFALTRASQAMSAFRHRFMDVPLTVNDEVDVKEWERNAYFGGRVECFQMGEIDGGPFVTLDINSMYPYVMANYPCPVRFMAYSDKPRLDVLDLNLSKYCVIARCELNTDEPVYPLISEGKLIFPTGRFSTFLCTQGLNYARDNNHLVNIREIAYYESAYIFKAYVDYFMELKMQYGWSDNTIMREVVKLFLNSLYGKFGQKKPLMETEDDITYDGYWREEIADLVTGEILTVTKLFNTRYATRGFTSGKKAMPAISAHVTEYARFYLWQLIKSIGVDRVLYCDTDGIKIRERDLPCVTWPMDNQKLGALKVEDRMESLTIFGPKDYETEKGFKAKGVPRSAKRLGPGHYKYTEFPGQSTHLWQGQSRYFITQEKEKFLSRRYDKGRVLPNGRVIPFHL